jgi:hypothetical protein
MKSRHAYWLCQILGWASYSLIGAIGTLAHARPAEVAIGYGAYFLYSIALTHWLRGYVRRRGWLLADHPRYFPAFLAAWCIGFVQAALVFGIDLAIRRGHSELLEGSVVFGAVLGISMVPLGWMTLYIAVTTGRRARERQLALRDAELRALELQINPHFLFNSLNSIRGLVIENPPLAQDLITRLANILRYNLHRDAGHTVPLESELEAAADYLALESARYEDRLRIEYAIAPETRPVPVPPMLVQTLVENAIKHGIATLPEGGDLLLSSVVEDGALVLRIANPVGQASPPANGRDAAAGLGLANLRERLRILYGPAAKLDLAAREGRATATVRIPQRP